MQILVAFRVWLDLGIAMKLRQLKKAVNVLLLTVSSDEGINSQSGTNRIYEARWKLLVLRLPSFRHLISTHMRLFIISFQPDQQQFFFNKYLLFLYHSVLNVHQFNIKSSVVSSPENFQHSETPKSFTRPHLHQTSTNAMVSSRASKLSSRKKSTAIHSPEPYPKSHLLTFPPEVRDTILKHLIQPEPIDFPQRWQELPVYPRHESGGRMPFKESISSWTRNLLVLTRICKQLYFEVVAIYYSRNTFTFDNANTRTSLFVTSLFPQAKELLLTTWQYSRS